MLTGLRVPNGLTCRAVCATVHSNGRTVVRGRQQLICRAQADLSRQFQALSDELDQLFAGFTNGSSNNDTSKQAVASAQANDLGLVCDENGCVILNSAVSKGPTNDINDTLDRLLAGDGWTLGKPLGKNVEDPKFSAVVGGDGWTVSLTSQELSDFILALKMLRSAIGNMLSQEAFSDLAVKVPIKVKWETETVTMEATCAKTASGSQDHFAVTFMVGVGALRAVKAAWPASVVQAVLETLDTEVPNFNVPSSIPQAKAPTEAVQAAV